MSDPSSKSMIGHNYFPPFDPLENDESVQVVIRAWRPLLKCLDEIPAKYLWEQMNNPDPAMHHCCRDPENLQLEIRKSKAKIVTPDTGEELTYPDVYVMKCGCGRRHRRLLMEPMHIGNPANKPKHVHNPFFKESSDAEQA